MTHPSGTRGLSHLLIAADAELPLVVEVLLYLGKAYTASELVSFFLSAAHRDVPTSGICLRLPFVLSPLYGRGFRSM